MGKFTIGGSSYEAESFAEAKKMHEIAKKKIGGPEPVKPPSPIAFAPKVDIDVDGVTLSLDSGKEEGQSSTGPITVVHRADSRGMDDKTILRDGGFACQSGEWCIRETVCARTFVKKLLDPALDTSKIGGFKFADEVLSPVKSIVTGESTRVGLHDVMATIKRVLKDTRAFWVSTSLNSECGGYASRNDYNCYQFKLPKPLKQYELVMEGEKNSLRKVERRSSDQVPTLCMDGHELDGSDSTIIAINSGPINDCEISFLTRIKKEWVTLTKARC